MDVRGLGVGNGSRRRHPQHRHAASRATRRPAATRAPPAAAAAAPPGKTEIATDSDTRRETVRERYATAARASTDQAAIAGCCEPNPAGITDEQAALSGAGLYADGERDELLATALMASLGCGNPTAMAELHDGMTVLDLGSGGGIDVLLSARRVAPTGTAYGLDMTARCSTSPVPTRPRPASRTSAGSRATFRHGAEA